ncbi:serine/threonine-protein kinase pak-1-like [Catharus ustulatus]|uniref:serine/threonine-protein kinase pak-1-like n=1 Tax=Catharus ustulatus TaxID=91951 RepID=UPI00140BF72F|nr:serine/threonine-protein kinase pak-1-like [Catharus ustulatus]
MALSSWLILSSLLSSPEQSRRSSVASTSEWMAPEVRAGQPYGPKVDIWSFGIVGIEMVEREVPRKTQTPVWAQHLTAKGQTPQLQQPKLYSPLLREFLSCCLQTDEAQRWSAKQLLQSLAGSYSLIIPSSGGVQAQFTFTYRGIQYSPRAGTKAQQPLSLLPALAHNNADDIMDQGCRVLLEERLQHLNQNLSIWPVDAKAMQDAALYGIHNPPPAPNTAQAKLVVTGVE